MLSVGAYWRNHPRVGAPQYPEILIFINDMRLSRIFLST
jgi:hypothetical protein